MATIKDVAKLAGVSTTTVSHVINKTRFVAENTQAQVWQAINSLNYSPSAIARSLKTNNTRFIGLLAATNEAPYFAEIIQAIEQHCYSHGYTLILCNTWNDLQKQQAYLAMLVQKRIDGLLVMCSEYPQPLRHLLSNYSELPMVIMDSESVLDNQAAIIQDNGFNGGYMATRYLIERGHRAIATITGQLSKHTGSARYEGYLQAMHDFAIPLREEWIVQGDFEPESGYRAMQQLLAQTPHPTAIVCGGDMMAMGAICAADEQGIRIPHDISIIGYDNVNNSRYFTPALSTIHQPKEQLASAAIELLLNKISKQRAEPQNIELQPSLIERRSVNDGPYIDYRRNG
ncbi:MAG: HTH-type transcriptional repressor PurR [Enterobacteriaceae bacterium]